MFVRHRRQPTTVLILKKIYVFARLLFNIRTVGSRPMTKAANKKTSPARGGSLLAALPGFEPRLTESESAVLPLDDKAIISCKKLITLFYLISQTFFNTSMLFCR